MRMYELSLRRVGNTSPYIPGQLLIRFKPSAVETVAHSLASMPSLRAAKGNKAVADALPDEVRGPLETMREQAGLKSMRPLFTNGRAGADVPRKPAARGLASARDALALSARATRHERLRGFQIAEVAKGKATDEVIRKISKSKAVEFVERVPNRWFATTDPMQNRQWGLRAVRWFEASRPSAKAVHVAVLDSGIDHEHPDLQTAVEVHRHDGNKPRDFVGHGTHVAGIIAAVVNNSVGISGIADCRLHAWKIFDDPPRVPGVGPLNFEFYSQALADAIDSSVKVVNLSIGGTESSQTEALLFRQLAEAGVLSVAAMGNEFEEGNPREFPGAYDGVLAIGATDETDRRARFSNTGRHIALTAPGVNVLSTVPRQPSAFSETTDYDAWPGTSMATPHVAGAAALLYAGLDKSAANAKKVARALTSTCRRVSGMGSKKFTSQYGHGILDIKDAIGAL